MPTNTVTRKASTAEQACSRDWLSNAATTTRRWRNGVENGLVLWAFSLLCFVIVWWIAAGLARRFADVDYGLRSAAAPWILGIATLLCAAYAVGSSMLWIKRWKDRRPSLAADVAAAQVIEEHYAFNAVMRFQEPEHGALIYFLHTTEDRVLTLYDYESSELGAQEGDPLSSSFRPMSKLVMVRLPQTGWVISRTFSGEPLEAADPIELAAPPEQWPEDDAYCGIPWSQLESVLGLKARST